MNLCVLHLEISYSYLCPIIIATNIDNLIIMQIVAILDYSTEIDYMQMETISFNKSILIIYVS